jgi:NitT/TauT family transport system ATP-binding protein
MNGVASRNGVRESFAIELADVVVDYAARGGGPMRALDRISLDVPAATFCAIIGPSGCGKSTVLRMLGGLLQPTAGTVTIGGRAPAAVAAAHRLGVAFQDHALLPWLSARDNVALPFRAVGRRVDAARVDRLLEIVGVRDFAAARPHELSGGMRQRVAIARALVLDPGVLLLDEPFGALDAVTRRHLNLEVQRIWSEHAITTLLVTHSVEEAVFLADTVIVMSRRPGRVERVTPIPFARPRDRSLLVTPAFHALVDDLTGALDAVDAGSVHP